MSDVLKFNPAAPNQFKGILKDCKIIIANNLCGYLDGEFTFEVVDATQARRVSTPD